MRLFSINLQKQSDEQLLSAVKRGNHPPSLGGAGREPFDELYRRYARRLQGFFYRQLGGDGERAADATQDVFLRIFEARERYAEGSNAATWIFTIAYNLCKNHYRHHAYVADYLATLDSEPAEEQQTELYMDRAVLHDALKEVLSSLPDPLHQLFSLRYEEELTVPQIAVIMDVPEGTIKSRLHKTMNIIRKRLKQYEEK